jgi:hypothetical protein
MTGWWRRASLPVIPSEVEESLAGGPDRTCTCEYAVRFVRVDRVGVIGNAQAIRHCEGVIARGNLKGRKTAASLRSSQ